MPPRTVTESLNKILGSALMAISKIEPFLEVKKTERELNFFEKKHFARQVSNIGECLTLLRVAKDECLNKIQYKKIQRDEAAGEKRKRNKKGDWLQSFINKRNDLLHKYPFDHFIGDEKRLNETLDFFEKNISSLKESLNNVGQEDKAEVETATDLEEHPSKKIKSDVFITKEIKPRALPKTAGEEETSYNILDYTQFSIMAIHEIENALKVLTDLQEIDISKITNYLGSDAVKENMPAILNCLENILECFSEFNKQYNKYDLFETIPFPKRLSSEAEDFFTKTASNREHISHVIENNLPQEKIASYIQYAIEIRDTYLNPVIEQLKENGLKLNAKLAKALTPVEEQDEKQQEQLLGNATTAPSSSSSSSSHHAQALKQGLGGAVKAAIPAPDAVQNEVDNAVAIAADAIQKTPSPKK